MRLQFLPGVIIALISLLRTDAYAQMRDQSPTDWRTFEVPEFGTRIQVPASIFAPAGKPERGSGQRFERSDGRAALSIYSRPNDKGENPAIYLRHHLRMDRAALDYVRIAGLSSPYPRSEMELFFTAAAIFRAVPSARSTALISPIRKKKSVLGMR